MNTLPLLLGLVLAVPAGAGTSPGEDPTHIKEILSPIYYVDQIYRSMKGPFSQEEIVLGEGEEPELIWITGYEAVMVDADGANPMPQDFMCHSNLDFDPVSHGRLFDMDKAHSGRLFTLSQGQFSIRLPEGFGIPVLSTEKLLLTTQVLNLNLTEGTAEVRHRVTLRFVLDRDLKEPMKPLFSRGVYGLALLEGEDGRYGMDPGSKEDHGPSCLMSRNASDHEYEDGEGRRFTGHWVVQPGREVNPTLVSKIMALPFDTTVHYIAVHLHPFAESLELRDMTADKTVFKCRARQFEDRIGLSHVDYFSSAEGIPLYKDHEYELISVYNNTTDEDQDSMAVMLLYLLDREFESPLQ